MLDDVAAEKARPTEYGHLPSYHRSVPSPMLRRKPPRWTAGCPLCQTTSPTNRNTARVLKQTPSLCGRMGGFDRLDDFEPFEFRVAEGERLALASVLMGGAELFRLGPCRKILLRRPYGMR